MGILTKKSPRAGEREGGRGAESSLWRIAVQWGGGVSLLLFLQIWIEPCKGYFEVELRAFPWRLSYTFEERDILWGTVG